MRPYSVALTILCLLTAVSLWSQSGNKEALESRRARLIEDIELTSRMVDKAKQKSEATLSDVQLMETQLKKRRELVRVLDEELRELKSRSSELRDSIDALKITIEKGKEEYGLILNQAYIKEKLEHPFQYLVNSASVFESFQKWIYLRQLKRYIIQKLDGLTRQTRQLSQRSAELEDLVLRQSQNLQEAEANKRKLEKEAGETREILNRIKQDLKSLESKLAVQRKERKKLNDAIEKLILAELERNRRRRESNALPEAEYAALSRNFEENKGRLPWPVRKGVITARFGRQSHPDIQGVYVDNTGIDMLTDESTAVYSIMDGKVVGSTRIAGHQNMVVVNHGDYYTVYSKLAVVDVEQGEALGAGQQIGRTGRAVDGLGNFHFEIWKGKSKVNPEQWIKR